MPALSVPVRANLDAFKKQMEETSSLARSAARKVTQHFLDANKSIASAAGAAAFNSAGIAALQLASRMAMVVGAAKLMGDAIGAARDQLKDMVDLANKAQNIGVSSSFLQSARAEAKKLQVGVEDLDGALAHAFNATKEKSPVDLAAWDAGKDRITDVERALRIYNETLAKSAGQELGGLVLFRDAKTQEDKVQAVLKAMIQLEQIGQRAAALDLGEKMFGSAFVDRIRQGRTSAESLLTTIQKASGDADGIFPDALVRRAKEMDDQLKVAHQRLSTSLKPSWDGLADTLLDIKSTWAGVVDLIAQAVELSNKLPFVPDNSLQGKRDALNAINRRLAGEDSGGLLNSAYDAVSKYVPGLANYTRSQLEQRRDELQAGIAADAKGELFGPPAVGQSRGTGDRPKLRTTDTGAGPDRLDTAADAIAKRTAALNAEAGALDLTTAARERAKIEAQLMTVAMQANAAAGKGENVVTEEQRQRINEVASAYSKAAEAIQKARVASAIKFDRQTSLLSPEDVQIASQLRGLYPDVATALNSVEANAMRTNEALRGMSGVVSSQLTTGLADILDGTKSVSDGFRDMSRAIVRALEEAMVKMLVVQPIMRGLQGIFGFASSAPVGVVGAAGSMAVPTFGWASGGYTGPGKKYEPAGIVHRGEYVMDAATTSRIGVANLDRMRGYASGGYVDSAPASGQTSGSTSISIGDIYVQVPEGTSAANAAAIGASVKASVRDVVDERIAHHLKSRGMLNRAS